MVIPARSRYRPDYHLRAMTMRGLLDFAFRWSSRCCFQGVGGEQRHAANIIEPSIELKDDKAGGHRFYSLSGCAPCIAPYIALPYILPPFPDRKKQTPILNSGGMQYLYNIYIYYIYPELRIKNCRFRLGKGVGESSDRVKESNEGAGGEQRGSIRE